METEGKLPSLGLATDLTGSRTPREGFAFRVKSLVSTLGLRHQIAEDDFPTLPYLKRLY